MGTEEVENMVPSTIGSLPITMPGFEPTPSVEAFAIEVGTLIFELGRSLDLSDLVEVSIAYDYDSALANLDRGDSTLPPLGRTNTEALAGVAKAVPVRRDGKTKTHIVVSAGPLACLMSDDATSDDIEAAIGVVAHECGHAEEHTRRERQFPGSVLADPPSDFVGKFRWNYGSVIWEEYAACRGTSLWNRWAEDMFRENLASSMKGLRNSAWLARADYQHHHQVDRVFYEVAGFVVPPLKMAAYLLGHLDGLADAELDGAPHAAPTDDPIINEACARLQQALRQLWDDRERWSTPFAFEAIGTIALETVARFGVSATPRGEGAWIDVRSPVWQPA